MLPNPFYAEGQGQLIIEERHRSRYEHETPLKISQAALLQGFQARGITKGKGSLVTECHLNKDLPESTLEHPSVEPLC